MNTAEKLAATYLRLNGFLLLPQFTVFQGSHHGHVDLIGLRAKNSFSGFGDEPFLLDEQLFEAIRQAGCPDPKSHYLGLIAEVRTNEELEEPQPEHVQYVRRFLGDSPMAKLAFFDSTTPPAGEADLVRVGNRYALGWVISRIRSMNSMHRLTKIGSWTLSEGTLADILVMERMGAFSLSNASTPSRGA